MATRASTAAYGLMVPARVDAVCVVERLRPGYFHETAIDKRPQAGRVAVGALGLAGDRQLDRRHGGRDAAVYVYATEDAEHWARVLGRDVPAGYFGENVRTSGLDVTGARIGERWRIGEVLLEVRQPRSPCANLSLRVGIDRFHVDFHRSGLVGAKCRVLETGTIEVGDAVVVELRPEHDVTIGGCATGLGAAAAQGLLDSGMSVLPAIRARARRAAERDHRASPR